MAWGDPGVTERQLILETPIADPTQSGGQTTGTLQRAGFLERLRFNLTAQFDQSAGTGAPVKSVKSVLGSVIDRITLQANGMLPLIDLSGLMAMIYNEITNRDGSPLAPVAYQADMNISAAAALAAYPAGATGVVSYIAKHPFEFQLAIPLMVNQQKVEWGLWLLQNQTVDLGLQVRFNALFNAAASVDALYSGGTGVVGTTSLANTKLDIERSLYTVPAKADDYPDINWAHQIIEFTQPIVSNYARFDVPKAGILLRALLYTEDANGLPVEYTDIKNVSWVYGANAAPIVRTGAFLTNEFVHDYDRYPPKGVAVLDFYKWGGDGLKLVKSTQDLANLRIETNYTATASGKQRIVLDRMVPIAKMAS
jgi:hypothetical protein